MYARRAGSVASLLAAATSLALGGVLGACGDGDSTGSAPPPTTAATTSTASTTVPTTTTVPAATTSTTTTPPTPPTPTTTEPPPTTAPPSPASLGPGAHGREIVELQERLQGLRYWVGPLDGDFGLLTQQAVYAFQKVNGLDVDGRVGPATRARLADPVAPVPQSTAGVVWEVDKAKQVLMVVRDGRPEWIWNTSTGTERPYTHDGRQLMADTPVGHLAFTWQVDGWRHAPLGLLYRPKYFHPDGIAIHGYSSVPPYPASHGCVRVTNAAMDAIWATGLAPLGAPIWIYGRSPGT